MTLPFDARVFIAAILAVSTPATAADYSLPPRQHFEHPRRLNFARAAVGSSILVDFPALCAAVSAKRRA
jgi:hypothetical protein